MKVLSSTKKAGDVKDEALVFCLFEKETKLDTGLETVNKKLNNLINNIIKNKDFKGEIRETYGLSTNNQINSKRIILTGLGKKKDFNLEKLRKAIAAAVKHAKKLKIESLSIYTKNISVKEIELSKTIVESILMSNYVFEEYKTKDKTKQIKQTTIIHNKKDSLIKEGIKQAEIISNAVDLTRDLVNEPAKTMTPLALAKKAQEICRKNRVKCTVIKEDEIRKQKMNALLAVASGSSNKPAFIIMDYNPRKSKDTIVLVGKGITFDSGGLGIKPAQYMKNMKGDMAGAAAVIGTIKAASELKIPLRIIGLIAAAENMLGQSAYRPGDIIKALNKKTIEILHTDAEGRVTLADALSYAHKYKPNVIIDIATLTGATVIALGGVCAAIMGNNKNLINKISKAGEETFERVWPFPLFEEYTEMIKGEVSDVKNIAFWDGEAGLITSGSFLKEFIYEKSKWAHIDIGGTAFTEKEKDYYKKGATGYGVRLLTNLFQNWKK